MRNQSKNYNCDCFVISTNQVIKIRKAKQSQLKIITFFIPDSDCGVLKKKIGRDGNEFAWTSGDLYFFFQQRNRFDYSLTPSSKYQKMTNIH